MAKRVGKAEGTHQMLQRRIAFMAIMQERKTGAPSLERARNRARQILTKLRGSITKPKEVKQIDALVVGGWAKITSAPIVEQHSDGEEEHG